MVGGRNERAGRGFRVYLRTLSDYTAEVKGLQRMGLRAGRPAKEAGLLADEVSVGLGGKIIKNVCDYTFALQECKPGEKAGVTVLRGERRPPSM